MRESTEVKHPQTQHAVAARHNHPWSAADGGAAVLQGRVAADIAAGLAESASTLSASVNRWPALTQAPYRLAAATDIIMARPKACNNMYSSPAVKTILVVVKRAPVRGAMALCTWPASMVHVALARQGQGGGWVAWRGRGWVASAT